MSSSCSALTNRFTAAHSAQSRCEMQLTQGEQLKATPFLPPDDARPLLPASSLHTRERTRMSTRIQVDFLLPLAHDRHRVRVHIYQLYRLQYIKKEAQMLCDSIGSFDFNQIKSIGKPPRRKRTGQSKNLTLRLECVVLLIIISGSILLFITSSRVCWRASKVFEQVGGGLERDRDVYVSGYYTHFDISGSRLYFFQFSNYRRRRVSSKVQTLTQQPTADMSNRVKIHELYIYTVDVLKHTQTLNALDT